VENGAVVVLVALTLVTLSLAAALVAQFRRTAVVAADPALAAAVGALRLEVQRSLGATEQYECLARPDDDLDLAAYCAARRVIPASPNTLLAYLRVVSLGLRGLAIEESARDLQARVGQAATELGRLRELHRVASGHLDNAQRKLHEADAALARTALVIEGLGGHAGADFRGAAEPRGEADP